MKAKIKIDIAIIISTIIYWLINLAGDILPWFIWSAYCLFVNLIYIIFDIIWWQLCKYLACFYYRKNKKQIKYYPALIFSNTFFYIGTRVWIEHDKGVYDYILSSLVPVLIPKIAELFILSFKTKNKQQ